MLFNLKEKLIELEEEFNQFRFKFEKKYLLFLVIYFTPPLALIFILSRYNRALYDTLFIKIIIFAFIVLGTVIHFTLKYTYYKTNKRYKSFIETRFLDYSKNYQSYEEFKTNVIETLKEIYLDTSQKLSNITIKNSPFLKNVFIILNIEIEE
ncbi:MAG TPA: hypothetical protein PK771_09685 [Spirochaetota bacterium]|nr:hypothetical protein [Spirochaetota bacterium]